MATSTIKYSKGSGNVFADLGLSNPEERSAKASLAMLINQLIDKEGLTQKQIAAVLGINQPKVSALMNGQLAGFSLEKLIHFLIRLNQDVDILVKPVEMNLSTHHGTLKVSSNTATVGSI